MKSGRHWHCSNTWKCPGTGLNSLLSYTLNLACHIITKLRSIFIWNVLSPLGWTPKLFSLTNIISEKIPLSQYAASHFLLCDLPVLFSILYYTAYFILKNLTCVSFPLEYKLPTKQDLLYQRWCLAILQVQEIFTESLS